MSSRKGKTSTRLLLLIIFLTASFLPSLMDFNVPEAKASEGELPLAEEGLPEIKAHAGVLLEFSTGKIVFSQHGEEQRPPASLTKIMTTLLTFEAVERGDASWDDVVVVSEKAWQQGGSQMFLNHNQEVTLEDLIKGVVIVSANDACVAIAEHLSGSEKLFLEEMNAKASELGLVNTRFQNTSGLPQEEHYTSAEDTARLAKYLVERFPEALELYTTEEFTFNDITQYNRNPLLGSYPGADGIKTGYTSEAGFNLVGTASRDGMRFISVVMKSASNAERLRDSELLLDYGFHNYTLRPLFTEGERINAVTVTGGVEREVDLYAEKEVKVVVPIDRKDHIETRLEIPEILAAPVAKGQAVGHLEVTLDEELLSRTELGAAESIEKAGLLTRMFRSVGDFFSSLWEGAAEGISDFFRSVFSSD